MAAMATSPALMEPMAGLDVDKLSYEIFSILESKFLFGYDDPKLFPPAASPEIPSPVKGTPRALAAVPAGRARAGKVRILSIDGGGPASDGLLAAAALARLESSLRRLTGDSSARITDFFDVAAGSGAGGVLAAMLFTRGPDGSPLFSAEEALRFFTRHRGRTLVAPQRGGLRGLFQRSRGTLRRAFGDATLRDAVKPVLVPCYDLATGAPFLFSRADAVETDGYDFKIVDVCAATCADAGATPVEMRSVDGRTRIAAVGGGVAMGNPAAAAITHVLNNKQEFPFAATVEDLMVVSLGTVTGDSMMPDMGRSPSPAQLARIAGESAADMVDQAISMAFGENRASNYVRIQGNAYGFGNCTPRPAAGARRSMAMVEDILLQRNVESSLFRGKKISPQTNAERLESFVGELVKEQQRRKKMPLPTVVMKQVMTPRTSSATTSTIITATTTSTSPSQFER